MSARKSRLAVCTYCKKTFISDRPPSQTRSICSDECRAATQSERCRIKTRSKRCIICQDYFSRGSENHRHFVQRKTCGSKTCKAKAVSTALREELPLRPCRICTRLMIRGNMDAYNYRRQVTCPGECRRTHRVRLTILRNSYNYFHNDTWLPASDLNFLTPARLAALPKRKGPPPATSTKTRAVTVAAKTTRRRKK